MIGRRSVLRGAAAAAGLTVGGCATVGGASRARPLGLADITVIRELARDYAGTLRKVAALGYTHFGFRLAGYGGSETELPPAEKARLVRAAGLAVGVVRLGVRNVDYDRQLDQAAGTGAKIVAMTTAPVFIATRPIGTTTRAAFDAWLPQLAAIGEKARARGLTLAYHNHRYDFVPLDGEKPLDLIARTVPPSLVSFEIDLAWAWFAGVAPLDLVRRLGPRVVSLHLKDVDRRHGNNPTDQVVTVGEGEMGYPALLPALDRATMAIGYVEVDNPPDGLAAATSAARFVQRSRASRGTMPVLARPAPARTAGCGTAGWRTPSVNIV